MSVLEALKGDNVDGIRVLTESTQALNGGLTIVDANEILKANPPPLSVAAFYRSPDCVRFLLANGANVARPDRCRVLSSVIELQFTLHSHQATSGLWSFSWPRVLMDIKWTIETSLLCSPNVPVHFAAMFGRVDAIKWIFANGYELDATNVDGE